MLALPVVIDETALRTAEERGELPTQLTLRDVTVYISERQFVLEPRSVPSGRLKQK